MRCGLDTLADASGAPLWKTCIAAKTHTSARVKLCQVTSLEREKSELLACALRPFAATGA